MTTIIKYNLRRQQISGRRLKECTAGPVLSLGMTTTKILRPDFA